MDGLQVLAFAVFGVAGLVMLLITQTRRRVAWPGWLVPLAAFVSLAGWTLAALAIEGPANLLPVYTASHWGLQAWCDRLVCASIAFFLMQNRARSAGMKSETWVILVIFTGGLALLAMLARMLYLERRQTG